jgi:hypothetical protein
VMKEGDDESRFLRSSIQVLYERHLSVFAQSLM